MTRLATFASRDARTRFLIVLVIVAVLWACTAVWLVPALIRSVYAGESLPALNGLIKGQDVGSVDDYLAFWALIAWIATAALVVVAAVVALGVAWRSRPLGEGGPAAARKVGARDVLLFAVWTGIVGGLAEAATARSSRSSTCSTRTSRTHRPHRPHRSTGRSRRLLRATGSRRRIAISHPRRSASCGPRTTAASATSITSSAGSSSRCARCARSTTPSLS